MTNVRGTLRRDGPSARALAVRLARLGRHHPLVAIDQHPFAAAQAPPAPGFHLAFHPHIPRLDAQLGFAARGHRATPFEELIQLHAGV
jgi:hypothetical protein